MESTRPIDVDDADVSIDASAISAITFNLDSPRGFVESLSEEEEKELQKILRTPPQIKLDEKQAVHIQCVEGKTVMDYGLFKLLRGDDGSFVMLGADDSELSPRFSVRSGSLGNSQIIRKAIEIYLKERTPGIES